MLVDVLALRTLYEECLPMPRAFTRLVWEVAEVRDRRPDDAERDLKFQRLDGGVEIGEEERARNRILIGGRACVIACSFLGRSWQRTGS